MGEVTSKQRKEALLSRRELEEMRARCERLTGVLTKPETLRMCSTLERAMSLLEEAHAYMPNNPGLGQRFAERDIKKLMDRWNRS